MKSSRIIRICLTDTKSNIIKTFVSDAKYLKFNQTDEKVEVKFPTKEILGDKSWDVLDIVWTSDPYCKPNCALVNLGYALIRIRVTKGQLSYSNGETIFTANEVSQDNIFKISAPPKYPTINVDTKIKKGLKFFGRVKKGMTNYIFNFENAEIDNNVIQIAYSIFSEVKNRGLLGLYNVDLNSFNNYLDIVKEKEFESKEDFYDNYLGHKYFNSE
jgi:hypothetical protein